MKFCVKSNGSSMDSERRVTYFYPTYFVILKPGVLLDELQSKGSNWVLVKSMAALELTSRRTGLGSGFSESHTFSLFCKKTSALSGRNFSQPDEK